MSSREYGDERVQADNVSDGGTVMGIGLYGSGQFEPSYWSTLLVARPTSQYRQLSQGLWVDI